ncbi:hypothetical protein [Neptunomonas qingdaonensis]|uniref:Uncharacterized protein n=1 Tax=Neptunomonas qingdaonensis TaxID=1045558 RepID=A0A1I2W5L5_9GAMM|nr:hypothetical protein [Neptunomonas qingdaonensis]SFG94821.1 hypothetical protein SAMN05216175_12129 [Neptunomonas qingdaonensis]
MRFLLQMLWLACIPDWMRDQQPDSQHFYRRQFTKKYQRKCTIVRRLWVCSGLLILLFPTIPFAAAISLLSTFLSFCLLDET